MSTGFGIDHSDKSTTAATAFPHLSSKGGSFHKKNNNNNESINNSSNVNSMLGSLNIQNKG